MEGVVWIEGGNGATPVTSTDKGGGVIALDVNLAGSSSGATVSLVPATSGGCSVYRNINMGATGAAIKASAGQLYGWYLSNRNSTTVVYVKIYDKGSAPSSADTPIYTLAVPAGSAANVAFPNGVQFALGIGIRATTGVADNDNTGPSANDVIVNVNYK